MRVALAGVGHWHASMHLDAVRAAGAAPALVWDADPAIAARFAALSGCGVAGSLEALLADRPDLVVVMGHPLAVPDMARACLDVGVPMILEKPAAASTEILARIAPGAAFVAVPFPNRCAPLWTELDRLRDEGRAGRLAHASFRIVNGPPERYRIDGVGWLLDPAVSGGGCLRNLGLHAADAALCLFGVMPDVVGAVLSNRAHGERVEDHASAILTVSGGPTIVIEAGYTFASLQPGGDFEWRVVTSNATLIDRGDLASVTTLDDAAARGLPPLPASDRYRAFMADTLERLRAGRSPLVGFDDYVAAMTLVDRITEAAR